MKKSAAITVMWAPQRDPEIRDFYRGIRSGEQAARSRSEPTRTWARVVCCWPGACGNTAHSGEVRGSSNRAPQQGLLVAQLKKEAEPERPSQGRELAVNGMLSGFFNGEPFSTRISSRVSHFNHRSNIKCRPREGCTAFALL